MIRDIRKFFRRLLCRHNPLSRLPAWKQAAEAEKRALSRGCTREIGRARREKYRAVHAALAASRQSGGA